MVRLALFWLSLIIGGLLLGAADPKPANIADAFNWDAVGALAVIATGFVGGTWFIVSMAIHSAIVESEKSQAENTMRLIAELRSDMSDPEIGFVPIRECRLLHAQTADALKNIKHSNP
mgnify:CR=1 FL=1